MITLTKLNGIPFVLNCEMIETVQANPDTTIHLTNGKIYIVEESVEEVVQKTVRYRQDVFCRLVHPETLVQPDEQPEQE